jgi:hypothetical protein
MAFVKRDNKNKKRFQQQNPLFKRKRFCRFTVAGVEQIDYKDLDTLKDFIGDNGKILVFPLAELPEMPRGKGVKLQAYREGGLRDATAIGPLRREYDANYSAGKSHQPGQPG